MGISGLEKIMEENNPVLQAKELFISRGSGDQQQTILKGAGLTLHPGEIVFLHGPSGTGKSTLLWVLARMIPLDQGRLLFEGRDSTEWPPAAWRERVALVMQKHSMVGGTVQDNLLLPWRLKIRQHSVKGSDPHSNTSPGEARLRSELDRLDLKEVALGADAEKLSVGQTARISLLRTLLTKPACLLLDEPAAALDPDTAAKMMNRVQSFAREGGAVLLAGHNRAVSQHGRVLYLEEGRLNEVEP